jgi:hypothetical protein
LSAPVRYLELEDVLAGLELKPYSILSISYFILS